MISCCVAVKMIDMLMLCRLLREMGWTEVDDDNNRYEITEDDVREFENLCRQMKLNKACNVHSYS